jgi:hypothetical protein
MTRAAATILPMRQGSKRVRDLGAAHVAEHDEYGMR